jgi:hypothetical protein
MGMTTAEKKFTDDQILEMLVEFYETASYFGNPFRLNGKLANNFQADAERKYPGIMNVLRDENKGYIRHGSKEAGLFAYKSWFEMTPKGIRFLANRLKKATNDEIRESLNKLYDKRLSRLCCPPYPATIANSSLENNPLLLSEAYVLEEMGLLKRDGERFGRIMKEYDEVFIFTDLAYRVIDDYARFDTKRIKRLDF